MKPFLAAALALVALVGCSSAKKSDGQDETRPQLSLASMEVTLTHSNVSQFDEQVAILVRTELVNGNTVVTIPRITSWPVQNTFLGLDHFYYGACATDHPVIRIMDEGCDQPVVNGEACGWRVNYDGCVADGFGCFLSRKTDGPASHGATTQDLVFVLQGAADFLENDRDANFAVHGRFGGDCSGWFSDGTATSVQPQNSCQPWPERTCSMSVDPQEIEIMRGSWGSTIVTVDEEGAPPLLPVNLSIVSMPPGISVSLNPGSVNPPGTSELTVHASMGAPLGWFDLVVLGQGFEDDDDGDDDHYDGTPFQCRATLRIGIQNPPLPECTLSVVPAQLQIVRGSWGMATVTVGESGLPPLAPITLAVDPLSLPNGVTVGLIPNPVNPPGTSQLTVQTMMNTPLGLFQIPVLGEGMDVTGRPFWCRTTLGLDIQPPPPPGACYCPVP